MNNAKKVKIFGDSILKGILLDPIVDRYFTIQKHGIAWLEKQFDLEISNRSMFGCTVTKGMRLLERAQKKGIDSDWVLLEFGGNDCDFSWEEVARNPELGHLPHTPLKEFEGIYLEMISRLKAQHIRPLLMTLPPIDARRYFDWIVHAGLNGDQILKFLGGDVQTIARFQESYSRMLSSIAERTQTRIVDIRSRFTADGDFSELLCRDGIHPNERGHARMTAAFSEFADRQLNHAR